MREFKCLTSFYGLYMKCTQKGSHIEGLAPMTAVSREGTLKDVIILIVNLLTQPRITTEKSSRESQRLISS